MNSELKQQIEISSWNGQIYMDRNSEDRPVLKIYLKRRIDFDKVIESEIFISDEDAKELRLPEIKEKYAINKFDYSQIN